MVGTLSRCLRGCALPWWPRCCSPAAPARSVGTVRTGRAPVAEPASDSGGGLADRTRPFPARVSRPSCSTPPRRIGALQDIDGVAAGSVVNSAAMRARRRGRPMTPLPCRASTAQDGQQPHRHGDAAGAVAGVTSVEQLTRVPVVHRSCRGDGHVRRSLSTVPAGAAGGRRRQLRRRPDRDGRVIGSMRRTLTLAAQIGDMRVSATWLHEGTSEGRRRRTPSAGHTVHRRGAQGASRRRPVVYPQSRIHPQTPAAAAVLA